MNGARRGTTRAAADVPKGLLWVDGIRTMTPQGPGFECLCVSDRRIQKRTMPFVTALTAPLVHIGAPHFNDARTEMLLVEIRHLERAECLYDPRDLLKYIVPSARPSRRHHIYKISGDPPVYIPALLIIRALFAGNRILDSLLMVENGADLLGTASVVADAVEVVPGIAYPSSTMSPVLPRRVAWMQLCSDARCAHASVLQYARQGEIAIRLPRAALTCWVWGMVTDVGVLATELNGIDLRLPIPKDTIIVAGRDDQQRFPSYTPRRKSALSSGYTPRPRGAMGSGRWDAVP